VSAATLQGWAATAARIRAVARRHAYVLWRSPHRLFDVTVWPLVDTVLFGSIAVFFARQGGSQGSAPAVGYLLAGIVLWHVVYQSQIAVSTGFLEETWSRHVLSMSVTPMREWEFVAGVAAFGLVKLVLGVGVVTAAAVIFYAFDVTTLGLGVVPVMLLLLLAGWSVALFVIGLVLRFGNGAEAFAWGILFVVMPLSGVFYPVAALPVVLRPVSLLLPTTHAFAAGRALVDGRGLTWDNLGLAALTTLLVSAGAFAFLTRMLRVFRERGYVTRYT
jgi:ABC-2 type transport system permease protein